VRSQSHPASHLLQAVLCLVTMLGLHVLGPQMADAQFDDPPRSFGRGSIEAWSCPLTDSVSSHRAAMASTSTTWHLLQMWLICDVIQVRFIETPIRCSRPIPDGS
jgi:hypothetical protein